MKYVIGDIHGGYKGLIQVLERANFDYENDTLICLGDITDGWPEVAECVEHLLIIKNLIHIRGNHDDWTLRYMKDVMNYGPTSYNHIWYSQGGKATYLSYYNNPELIDKHIEFLNNSKLYYIDDENRIFMHAGFDPSVPLDRQPHGNIESSDGSNSLFFWDRRMWSNAARGFVHGANNYNEIYIGHTPTISEWKHGRPVNIENIWNMDTGSAYIGKLSLMNIETKELFQSDPVFMLYPTEPGRNGEVLLNDKNWNKCGLFYDDPRYASDIK